jgi:hypothetical protein
MSVVRQKEVVVTARMKEWLHEGWIKREDEKSSHEKGI